MLFNRNIIVFADDWGRHPSTMQHIGKILAIGNRILWIGSLGHRKPELKISDLLRVFEKVSKMQNKNHAAENFSPVIDFHPFIVPLHDFSIVRSINKKLLISKLKEKISELKFDDPVLITSSPVMESVVGELGESSAHYFCLDDYSLFENAFNSLIDLEKNLLRKVDTCFATASTLVNSRIPQSGKSYFLTQGVDVEHFAKGIRLDRKVNKRPVVGFFGLLSHWVDIKLITRCAKENPNFDFVLIGRADINITELQYVSNIKYVGEIPYDELPMHAAEFDVAMIPFKVNDLTIAVNPLKLLEYMAIGIPIVSTKLPEVEKFGNLVFVASNEDEFISFVRKAVIDNNPERNFLRRNMAEKYSWRSITEDISEKIMLVEKKRLQR